MAFQNSYYFNPPLFLFFIYFHPPFLIFSHFPDLLHPVVPSLLIYHPMSPQWPCFTFKDSSVIEGTVETTDLVVLKYEDMELGASDESVHATFHPQSGLTHSV